MDGRRLCNYLERILRVTTPEELRAIEQELGALPMSGERDFALMVAQGVQFRARPATRWRRFLEFLRWGR